MSTDLSSLVHRQIAVRTADGKTYKGELFYDDGDFISIGGSFGPFGDWAIRIPKESIREARPSL